MGECARHQSTTSSVTLCSGADVTHPAPGSENRPSFTSLVGSIDPSAVRYVSTMEVQTSRKEIIDAMESMATVRFLAAACDHID